VLVWLVAIVTILMLFLLMFGGNLLIASRPPAAPVNAAVVLQGSVTGEKVRTAGAIKLLQQGTAQRILLSIPKESYWGQSIPPIARAYLERTFGLDLASRIDFCETGDEVDSTAEEMQALTPCIREHQYHSIVVVTSNYHTRRAGIIWKKFSAQNPGVPLWIFGVDDPEFQQPWWRHRRSAKTFVMEFTKLIWTGLPS
jgi:uncharacterized SAM-binding protein YcdF (DUF218 family)